MNILGLFFAAKLFENLINLFPLPVDAGHTATLILKFKVNVMSFTVAGRQIFEGAFGHPYNLFSTLSLFSLELHQNLFAVML